VPEAGIFRIEKYEMKGRMFMDRIRRISFAIPRGIIICLLLTTFVRCGTEPATIYTIGIINLQALFEPHIDGLKSGMAERGYIEDENIRYIYSGDIDPTEAAVHKEIKYLLSKNVDILFLVSSQAVLWAAEEPGVTGTPVVAIATQLFEQADAMKSINSTGIGLTGVKASDTKGKTLEWLKIILPEVDKVYVPYSPDDFVSQSALDALVNFSLRLEIELVTFQIDSVEAAIAAIENLPENVGAVFRIPSPTLDQRSVEVSRAAINRRIPLVACLPLDGDVLFSFGCDYYEMGKQASRLSHQILLGVNPADLPVETAETFLTINLKTAGKIGLEIPSNVLIQANTIIRE
jgi:putative ABC transport system substrate-binding protein